MAPLLQQIVNGVAIGCVYALVALGFVLIYKAMHVVNFAQGELMMVGAFLLYTFGSIWNLGYLLGGVLAIVITALIGALLSRIVIQRMLNRHVLAGVIVTVAIGSIASNGVRMIPGWGTETYAVSASFAEKTVDFGPIVISGHHIAVVGATIALVACLQFFLLRTRPGLAIRALSQDRDAATRMGVPVEAILPVIWAASAATAALAGVLLAPALFVHADLGYLALHAFPAAVLGGFVSIPGTILGGIVVGVAEELAGFYLPEGVKNVMPHVILIAALAWKPAGFLSPRPASNA